MRLQEWTSARSSHGCVYLCHLSIRERKVLFPWRPLHACQREKMREDCMTVLTRNAFGMKLHSECWFAAMFKRHDQAIRCPRRGRKARRQGVRLDDERVIARGLKAIGQSAKQACSLMKDF